jgi:hypothetical protein
MEVDMRSVLAAAIVLGLAQPVRAETTIFARAGGWTAFGGTTNDGTATCGIDATDRSSGRHFLVQYYASSSGLLFFRTIKPSWVIPQGTRIPIEMRIDGNSAWTATAFGSGREIQWTLNLSTMGEFERQFRLGLQMTLSFVAGNEPRWDFVMRGTNAIMLSFADCIRRMGGVGTQPHATPTPEPPAITQPFTSAPPRQKPVPVVVPDRARQT